MPIDPHLTPAQRRAVQHVYGPMLVIAGAGSGKTKVLAERVAHLIESGAAASNEILCVTFTHNAATELCRRVGKMLKLKGGEAPIRALTFHSYCVELLRREGQDFSVVDDLDLAVFLNLQVADLPLNIFRKAASPGEFIRELLDFNSRCMDDLVDAADFSRYVQRLERDPSMALPRVSKTKEQLSREEVLARCKEIAAVYSYVDRVMTERNWGTFGLQILRTVRLLQSNAALLQAERQRVKFLLIDEFQDSNHAQITLASLLAGEHRNIFAVGDPDQSIYRFRGASSEAFEEFKRIFGDAKTVELDTNFRSLPPVLKTAFAVIDRNPRIPGRSRKPMDAQRRELFAEPVSAVLTIDAAAEARAIAEQFLRLKQQYRCAWSQFAILYRSHLHRNEIVSTFAARGIPLDVRGVDASGAPDVRDALAVLRAMADFGDGVSLLRIAALPQFNLDAGELRHAFSEAARADNPADILAKVAGGQNVLEELRSLRDEIQTKKLKTQSAFRLLKKRFDLCDSVAMRTFTEFIENWTKKPICSKNDLYVFLEFIDCYLALGGAISLDEQPDSDAVVLTTVHNAKGLEFGHVFVLRCNSGSFPLFYREAIFEMPRDLVNAVASPFDAKVLHEHEERRLFYVGMTRARDTLTLCAKPGSGRDTTPAGIVRELLNNKELKGEIHRTDVTPTFDIQGAASTYAGATSISQWLMLPPRSVAGPLALSASAVESYNLCPLQYKIRKDWGISGEVSAAQQYGNAMHAVLGTYFEAEKVGRKLELPAVLASFDDLLNQANIIDPLQRSLYCAQGRRQLAAFVEARQSQPAANVLATEKRFSFEVSGVRVHGRIDRMDSLSGKDVYIEDYKTGSPKDQEKADKSVQLGVYALAAQKEGLHASQLAFYNLANNTTVVTTRDSHQLAKVEEVITNVADGIRSGRFEPKAGFHCKWCSYQSICPAKEERLFTIQMAATVQ